MSVSVQQWDAAAGVVRACVERAMAALLGRYRDDGCWQETVDAGIGPAVDYLLLDAWLRGRGSGLGGAASLAGSIVAQAGSQGGFSASAGGPFDLDLTVRTYAALRLSGVEKHRPEMVRCLAAIHDGGGLDSTGALARLDLNFAGLCPREACLSVPVEVMFFEQRWLEPLAAWARAVAVPLAIVQMLSPEQESPPGLSGMELSAGGNWPAADGAAWLRWWCRHSPLRLRKAALRRAETWLVDRVNRAGAMQESFPAIRYTVMALELLGYTGESAVRHRLSDCLSALAGDRAVQPYSAPVRDDALVVRSLDEASESGMRHRLSDRLGGLAGDGAVQPCSAPVRDAAIAGRSIAETGGAEQQQLGGGEWGFQGGRVEDTATILLAQEPFEGARDAAIEKAVRRLLAMQSEDGGWASFERARRRSGAPKLAGIDPRTLTDCTSPGTTGLVLEAVCRHGVNGDDPAVRRAVAYLVRSQDLDGSWIGQWPGSYIGATCFAVAGLAAAGEDPHEAHVLRAGEWLRSGQNADGGWGEDPAGLHRGEYVPGESTAAHAAWALIGLMASGDRSSDSVRRGAAYLVETQAEGGDWEPRGSTGTWQAGLLPTLSALDCLCYPMLALARFLKNQSQLRKETA